MNRVRKAPIARQIINSDPAREAVEAARRNIDHDDAVQATAALQRRFCNLWGPPMAASPIDLNLVLRTLIDKKIPFVLTGAHGYAGWTGRPRNTIDVDILVKAGRNHARAVKAIRALYPELEVRNFPGLAAFFPPGQKESVIDVIYPHRADLEEALAHPVWTQNRESGLRYRVPSLEAALANKYGAMITRSRELLKRQQDAIDFSWMVVHSQDEGRQPIELEKLAVLGAKVWPGGGAEEILWMVDEVKAGRPINIDEAGGIAKRNHGKRHSRRLP